MAAPVTLRNFRDNYVNQAKPNKAFPNLARLHMTAASGSQRYTYIYFGKPWPNGSNITQARLQVWNDKVWSGSVTISVQRLTGPWAANRLDWNNRPGVTGPIATLTKSGAADETMWDIDISAIIQSVSNGAPWYGLRLTVNGSPVRKIFSSNAARVNRRPRVILQWSDAPEAPEDLSPGGGRAITDSHPTLSYTFTDTSGDSSLAAHQFQLASSETGFGSPLLDTGWLVASEPELDLTTTSYAGLAEGGSVWWRVRVQDGAGLQSEWSAPTQFRRTVKGTLNITSMGTKALATNLAINPFGKTTTNGVYTEGVVGLPGSGGGGVGFGDGPFGEGPFGGITSGDGEVIATQNYGLLAVNGGAAGAQYLASRANVTAGQKYSFLVSGGLTDTLTTARVRAQWLNSSGSTVGTIIRQDLMSPQEFGKIIGRADGITAPTGATQLIVGVETPSLPTGVGIYLDNLLIQQGDSLTTLNVFDGSTEDSSSFSYSWTGAEYNSPSSMSGYYVEDTSPPIFWSFTGQAQKAYRAQIWELDPTNTRVIWDTGKVTSTSNSIDTPDNLLKNLRGKYRLYVSIWDDQLREKVGNEPIEVTKWIDFVYSAPTSVSAPAGLTAAQQRPWPWVQLNFTRSTPPDSFTITRNGQVLENNVDPEDLFVGGTSYQYIDKRATPRTEHKYRVIANVNRVDSQPSNEAVVKAMPPTSWLMEPDTRNPIVLTKSASSPGSVIEVENRSSQQLHQPVGGGSPVLVSQFVSGYEGKVEAVLAGGIIPGLTSESMISRYKEWRKTPGRTLLLYTVNDVMEIVPYDMTYRARAKSGGEILYDISFSFYEMI